MDGQVTGPRRGRERVGTASGFGLVLLAIVAFLVLGGFEAWHDSATFDEPVYVSSGVVAVLHHDWRTIPSTHRCSRCLAALPVLAVGPVVPPRELEDQQRASYSARFAGRS